MYTTDMPEATSQISEHALFTAYTVPATHELGNDAKTGEPLSYPVHRIVGMTHENGAETHRVGDIDREDATQIQLRLPAQVGVAAMGIVERPGSINCHGFANAVGLGGRPEYGNGPTGRVEADQRTVELNAGEIGMIGSPTAPYAPPEMIVYNHKSPGDALHSVVGLGPTSKEVIHVDTLFGRPGIVHIADVLDSYTRLTGIEDMGLHKVPPSRERIEGGIDIMNPFDTNTFDF